MATTSHLTQTSTTTITGFYDSILYFSFLTFIKYFKFALYTSLILLKYTVQECYFHKYFIDAV
jgi:hypothetical protein